MAEQQMQEQQSLFTLLGSSEAVTQFANKLIQSAITDDRIKHYFKNTNIVLLKESLAKHLILIFGGPNEYKGTDMRNAHKHLKLSEKDFLVYIELFTKTLKEFKVEEQLIKNAVATLEQLKNDVLDK